MHSQKKKVLVSHGLEESNQGLEIDVRAGADSFALWSHRCARRTAIPDV
jgi:hypothetical protein